jgi:hypothetical protein
LAAGRDGDRRVARARQKRALQVIFARRVACSPRARKFAIARLGVNFFLTARHEIAVELQWLRRIPVETPPVSGSIFFTEGEVIRKAHAMTFDRTDHTGFTPPPSARARGHRSTALAQLVTSAALVLSIAVAATAVSVGIARADGLTAVAEDSSTHVAVLLSLVLVGMGGLTAWMSLGGARVNARGERR